MIKEHETLSKMRQFTCEHCHKPSERNVPTWPLKAICGEVEIEVCVTCYWQLRETKPTCFYCNNSIIQGDSVEDFGNGHDVVTCDRCKIEPVKVEILTPHQKIMQAVRASKLVTQHELDIQIIRQVEYLQGLNDDDLIVYNAGLLVGLLVATGLNVTVASNLVKEVTK